jgi:hypothetical protein
MDLDPLDFAQFPGRVGTDKKEKQNKLSYFATGLPDMYFAANGIQIALDSVDGSLNAAFWQEFIRSTEFAEDDSNWSSRQALREEREREDVERERRDRVLLVRSCRLVRHGLH